MGHIGIIGGSGVYDLECVELVTKHEVETPFGSPSSLIFEAKVAGRTCYFLPRHGQGHKLTPSEINYRANVYALKSLGVDTVVSISAVGSLKEEYAPTHFVLPDQFIDWTKGQRERSFFSKGMVGHVSNAYPVSSPLQTRVAEVLGETDVVYHKGGTYICIEGPQFSTKAESLMYRSFGCDVIGMTNVPEAFLAKEAGMAYTTVAMVTDYDCWREGDHCTVEEIMSVMKNNYASAQKLVEKLVPSLVDSPISFEKENTYAVVTNPDFISEENKTIINVLTK